MRQGCNASTVLFKLLIYEIINKLEKSNIGFNSELFKINTLFFLFSFFCWWWITVKSLWRGSKGKFKNSNTVDVSKECGLEINKENCNVIIFNMNEQPENIEGINVVDSIKYLGVTINNTRKCFTRQKRIMIEKAQKMA